MISPKFCGFVIMAGIFLNGISARELSRSDFSSVIPCDKEFFAIFRQSSDLRDVTNDETYFLKFVSPEDASLLEMESRKHFGADLVQEGQYNMTVLNMDTAQVEKLLLTSTTSKEKCPSVMYCKYGKFDPVPDVSITREELEKLAKISGGKMVEEAVKIVRSMEKEVSSFDAIVNLKDYDSNKESAPGSLQCIRLSRDVKKRDADANYDEREDMMFFFNAPSNLAMVIPWMTNAFVKLDATEALNFNVLGGPMEISLTEGVQLQEISRSGEQFPKTFHLKENWIAGVSF